MNSWCRNLELLIKSRNSLIWIRTKEEERLEKLRAKDLKLFLRKEQALLRKEQSERQKKFLQELRIQKQIERFRIREVKELEKLEKIKLLGEKSFKEEENIARVYPNGNLFSHILGQIDTDNNGVSGIEKSFDYELTTSNKPLMLSLDTEIQYLIREELIKFQEIFNSYGSTAILMNVNSGEILSMVSIPDFDLNK